MSSINGVSVNVRNGDVDKAIRLFKKKAQLEGVVKDLNRLREYEKPSVKKRRKKAEAIKRERKLLEERREKEM